MILANDPTLGQILECPLIASLLHEHQLLAIPFIQIRRLDKRVHDPILPMFTRTVNTQMDSQMDGSPGRVLFLTIDADLYGDGIGTLFLFIFLSYLNVLSLTYSVMNYIGQWGTY